MPASAEWKPGIVRARKVELHYARQLRKLARTVADIIEGFAPAQLEDLTAMPAMLSAMEQYAEGIEPWARAAGASMLHQVNVTDLESWAQLSRIMKRELKREIMTAPTGIEMRRMLGEQVALIQSIPREAGERVHQWCLTGIADGTRAAEVSRAIQDTYGVTVRRGDLIARTEVARTASFLVQAHAQHIGSPGYEWVTAGDADVRPSHRTMSGKYVDWNAPPTLDKLTGHAGALPNCRCFPAPLIP
ncbi:MAG: phage minor head protein [Bradyrhizobium sp.]